MKIRVVRYEYRNACTIGRLSIDGVDAAIYTLEDKVRELPGVPVSMWKEPGETAIPCGTYKIEIRHSRRFKRDMPYLLGVPGFEGTLVHYGNTADDTAGCILVGRAWNGADAIYESRCAFDDLFKKIKAAKEVEIQITGR